MTWIIFLIAASALWGAYRADKTRRRLERRRLERKMEARRIAARQAGELKYDEKKEN